jgi:hypothetical protein
MSDDTPSGKGLAAAPAPRREHDRRWRWVLALAVAALTAGLYGRTLQFGWHWDDYHQVRPYTRAEVADAFHGPWDPGGPEATFYRPLTVVWFALRFELFGFSSAAHHTTSLVLLAACAWLAGLLAARLTDSRGAGAAAAALLLLHPVTPDSLAVWVANQPHLFALLIALFGANWVLAREPATYVQWLPGLLAVCLSFGFKEDGLMLLFWLPALLAARQRRLPRLRFVFVVLATAVLLVVLRDALLGELGGYTSKRLGLAQLVAHALRGPASVLALGVGPGFQLLQLGFPPGDRSLLQVAATLSEYVAHYGAIATLAVGAVRARRSPALLAGVSALVLFNAPLIWQSKATGWHHLILGAVLVWAAAGREVARRISPASSGRSAPAFSVLAALLLAPINVVATNAYHPCAAAVRTRDEGADVREWIERGLVPPRLRGELERKRQICAVAP